MSAASSLGITTNLLDVLYTIFISSLLFEFEGLIWLLSNIQQIVVPARIMQYCAGCSQLQPHADVPEYGHMSKQYLSRCVVLSMSASTNHYGCL